METSTVTYIGQPGGIKDMKPSSRSKKKFLKALARGYLREDKTVSHELQKPTLRSYVPKETVR